MEQRQTRLRFLFMRGHRVVAALVTAEFAASLIAGATIASASRVPPYLPVPRGAAVILDTGSTNANGYRIVIQPSGAVEYATASHRVTATITSAAATKFFVDLAAAAPLGHLPSRPCMKSVSFGTSLFVWWWAHGRSPDLSCTADARGAALREDAALIASELNLSVFGAPVMRPLMPGEQHRPLPPAPSPSQT